MHRVFDVQNEQRFSVVDNISFKFCYGFALIEYVSVIAQTSITRNWIQGKSEKKEANAPSTPSDSKCAHPLIILNLNRNETLFSNVCCCCCCGGRM